jgi:hypothetical protein
MFRRTRHFFPFAALTVLLACAACGGPPQDDNAVSSADVTEGQGTPTPTSKNKKKPATPDKPLVPVYTNEEDGTPITTEDAVSTGLVAQNAGPTGAVSLDGEPCDIDKINLAVPDGNNGWTLTIDAHCGVNVMNFQATGTFDEAYPQTSGTGVLTISADDGATKFDATATDLGAESDVIQGPTSAAQAEVAGSDILFDAETFANHEVDFDIVF